MAAEVALNSPLAEALNTAINPKLVEVGWAANAAEASALSEYIILMLVNRKSQDQLASELASDVLSLSPDDVVVQDFAKWLFEQIDAFSNQSGANGTAPSNPAEQPQDGATAMEQDTDMSITNDPAAELNAYVHQSSHTMRMQLTFNSPTGPRSMRNGNARGVGREKRLFGQMAKAMDRSNDSVLHRVRGATGNERINAHNRTPPTGPRGSGGRLNNRATNNRASGIVHGLNNMAQPQGMGGMPGAPGMNGMNDMNWMMQPGSQEQIFSLLQQQNQMMAALQQQLTQQNQGSNNRGHGRSLFDRVQNSRGNNFRRGGHHANSFRSHHNDTASSNGASGDGEDVEMSQSKRDPPNPDTVICKFNLACTMRDCKFAHQSPAAPPGITIDLNDVCSYGAACKNHKCVGRHPSPATKRAHQIEQDCKFYPNCTNPKCPFKHPEMPICRNGGDCAVEGCKFTHLQTLCKYKPCTNRFCAYKHEDGQKGVFQDKVWTADGSKEHVSERRFVDNNSPEELVVPGSENSEALQSNPMDEGIA